MCVYVCVRARVRVCAFVHVCVCVGGGGVRACVHGCVRALMCVCVFFSVWDLVIPVAIFLSSVIFHRCCVLEHAGVPYRIRNSG